MENIYSCASFNTNACETLHRKISMTSVFIMDSWWNYVVFSLGSQIILLHLEFLESYWPLVRLRASLFMPKNDSKFVG